MSYDSLNVNSEKGKLEGGQLIRQGVILSTRILFLDLCEYQSVINVLNAVVRNFGVIPEGRQGRGNGAWLFVDEVRVEWWKD